MQLVKKDEILEIPIVAPWKFIKKDPVKFLKKLKEGDKLTIVHCDDNKYDAEAKYAMLGKQRLGFVSSDFIRVVDELIDDYFGLDVTFAYLVVNEKDKPWYVVRLKVDKDLNDDDLIKRRYLPYRFSLVTGIPKRDLHYSLTVVLKPLVEGYRNFINEMYEGKFSCRKINELNKLTRDYLEHAAGSLSLENRVYMVMVRNYMKWIKDYDRKHGLNRVAVAKNSELLEEILKIEKMKAKESFCAEHFERQYKEIESKLKDTGVLDDYYALKFHGDMTLDNMRTEKKLAKDSLYEIKHSPFALFRDDPTKLSKALFYQRFCTEDIYELMATISLIKDLEDRIKMNKTKRMKELSISNLFSRDTVARTCALFTDKTIPIWEKLCQVGLVDENFMILNMTKQLAAYMISRFAELLGLKNFWSEIERFWGVKYLAQAKSKYMETGCLPKGHEMIDSVFAGFNIL